MLRVEPGVPIIRSCGVSIGSSLVRHYRAEFVGASPYELLPRNGPPHGGPFHRNSGSGLKRRALEMRPRLESHGYPWPRMASRTIAPKLKRSVRFECCDDWTRPSQAFGRPLESRPD
jgi:hypothetical protein